MITGITLRFTILLCVALAMCIVICSGRYFVEKNRRRSLSAAPLPAQPKSSENVLQGSDETLTTTTPHVRILAFSSEECRQCRQLQAPVLRRVVEEKGRLVSVEEIDAPGTPELTQRYQVLTLPTTVLLDAQGKAQAVNYGFTNVMRLLQQIDEILEKEKATI